jgi:hypothetical protein
VAGLAAEKGDVEPIVVNTGRTGQTVTIKIFRASDNFFLDWSDNTFKVIGSVVTLTRTLLVVDAVNAPGHYELDTAPHTNGLHTSLLTNLTTTALEQLVVVPVATSPVTKLASGYLKIVPRIDGVTPERTVASRLNSMARGKVTLTGATLKPAQDAEYYDEAGAPIFKNRNTAVERNPVP